MSSVPPMSCPASSNTGRTGAEKAAARPSARSGTRTRTDVWQQTLCSSRNSTPSLTASSHSCCQNSCQGASAKPRARASCSACTGKKSRNHRHALARRRAPSQKPASQARPKPQRKPPHERAEATRAKPATSMSRNSFPGFVVASSEKKPREHSCACKPLARRSRRKRSRAKLFHASHVALSISLTSRACKPLGSSS